LFRAIADPYDLDLAELAMSAGHDSRVVNKLLSNFDGLCMAVLPPGRSYRVSAEGEEEEWLLVKPKKVGQKTQFKGSGTGRPFYHEKNSDRKQFVKPWTGKSRCKDTSHLPLLVIDGSALAADCLCD